MQGGTPLVAHATCAFLNLGRFFEKSAGPPGLQVGPVESSKTGDFKEHVGESDPQHNEQAQSADHPC